MTTFTYLTNNADGDINVLVDYFENTLTLEWTDDIRIGYEAILTALVESHKNNLGLYTVRFHLGEETAHRIMQDILHDIDELVPYATEPVENYYYDRQLRSLIHLVSMMMTPFFRKGE